MDSKKKTAQNPSITDKDEIFKSLSHSIRREIIKILGEKSKISFTEIKKNLNSVDSPTLSYHIKSLEYLLKKSNELYELTEIGRAALLLICKIDQSKGITKSKKIFGYANYVTMTCWIIIMIIIPILIGHYPKEVILWPVIIIINIMGQINFFINGRLWKSISNYTILPDKR